jgi:tetratricopeptide (TPR) repeat protein
MRLGDLALADGRSEEARRYFEDGLAIAKRLAEAEPGRADLAGDLSFSYNRLGDLAQAEGRSEEARWYFEDDLAIAKRLAEAEPGRADLARDLSISYNKLGGLAQAEGRSEEARRYFEDSLALAKRLAEAEPGRTDLANGSARSLSGLVKLDLDRGLRDAERAREAVRLARKALAPSPRNSSILKTLGDALCTLARCLEGDEAAASWTEGVAALRRAVEGDVSHAASLASHLRAYADSGFAPDPPALRQEAAALESPARRGRA